MDTLDLIKEGKVKRHFMTRKKLVYPGAIYHITQRAPGKEPLFLEEADYLFMLHLIKEKSKKFKFEVFSFALMPNHLHIQLKIAESNLCKAMKNIFESYANFFNKKYMRKGHVFCGTFRCALCFDDAYLLAVSLYIHLNPVRAKIVNTPVDYRWSSCGLYSSAEEKKTFINYQFILNILDEDANKSRKLYRELLEKASEIEAEEILENTRALDFFKIKLIKFLPLRLHSNNSEALGDKELDDKIAQLKNKQRLRSPQGLKARKFLIEQLMARGYSVTQIAKELKLTRQSVYSTLNLTL